MTFLIYFSTFSASQPFFPLFFHEFCTIIAIRYLCSNQIRSEAMGMPVRIDDTLYNQARATALAERRTIDGQIEFWAVVGRTALDNPDLPIDFIRDLLVARGEGPTLATPFVPEGKRD